MVSVEFAAITVSLVLLYIFLYLSPVRWHRLAGCFGIMIVSIGFGVIGDTIPMYIIMMVNLLIALMKLVEDVGEVLGDIR